MATPALTPELESIVTALASFPEGATIEQIEGAIPTKLGGGNLRLRLNILVKSNRVLSDGTRYWLSAPDTGAGSPGAAPATSPAAAVVVPDAPADAVVAPRAAGSDVPAGTPAASADVPPGASAAPAVASSVPPSAPPADTAPALPPNPAPVAVLSSAVRAAGPGVTSPPPVPRSFDDLFRECVVTIVSYTQGRIAAAALLQNAAQEGLASADERLAFVTYGKSRLQALTVLDAARYGIDADLFKHWNGTFGSAADAPPPHQTVAAESLRRPTPLDAPAKEEAAAPAEPVDATDRSRTTGKGQPRSLRGLARGYASQLAKLIGGSNPTVRLVIASVATAIVAPRIQWCTTHPYLAASLFVVGVGGALLIRWALAKPAPDSRCAGAGSAPEAGSAEPTPSAVAAEPSVVGHRSRARIVIAASGIAALAAVVGAVFWFRTAHEHPRDAAVREFVSTRFAPLPVRVLTLQSRYKAATDAGTPVAFTGVIATTAPLYRAVDSAEYLHANQADLMVVIDAAQALLNGPSGARLRALAGAAPQPALMASKGSGPVRAATPPVAAAGGELVLLTPQTPTGVSTVANGTALAYRSDGDWKFTDLMLTFDRSRFAGQPKGTGPAVFALEDPNDLARLNTLVVAHADYARKVQAATRTVAAELEQERRETTEAFAQLLRPGTLFTGNVRTPHGDNYTIVIEITENVATGHRVAALLRNDGGWADARIFRGEWTVGNENTEPQGRNPGAGADSMGGPGFNGTSTNLDARSALQPPGVSEVCLLSLRTRSEDLVRDAGPLLRDPGDFDLELHLHRDGTAAVTPWQGLLRRVDPTEAAAVKADLSRAIAPAVAATKPGTVYRGTATRRSPPLRTYDLVLRFVAQEPQTNQLRALLEVPRSSVGRLFRGTIVDNTYRVGSTPLRLTSPDSDRSLQADGKSPIGLDTENNSLALALRVDGTRLVGQDNLFIYTFAPTDDAVGGGQMPENRGRAADADGQLQRGSDSSGLSSLPSVVSLPPGAYALVKGVWKPLPENNSHIYQSTPQSLNEKLLAFQQWQDKQAGKAPSASTEAVADLLFDGRDPVPLAPSNDVTIVYLGGVTPPSLKDQEEYPQLVNAPPIELTALKPQRNGSRVAGLRLIAPRFYGFGDKGVSVTIEQPGKDITLLRSPKPLPAGRYGLFCGARSYELGVE